MAAYYTRLAEAKKKLGEDGGRHDQKIEQRRITPAPFTKMKRTPPARPADDARHILLTYGEPMCKSIRPARWRT